MLSHGKLQLLLNRPGADGAGQAMSDGQLPASGGWNRIQLEVEDLAATVAQLQRAGAAFATRSWLAMAASNFWLRIHPAT
jgi:hypothetical protein